VRKISIKKQILRLIQGYPQDWIYIERKILYDLNSKKTEGVKGPINFVGQMLSDAIKREIIDVNSREIATIRPIIGPNGAGKTTQMELQIKKYVNELFGDKSIYLFFDFKYVSDNENEFWPIFIQNLYGQIQENKYLNQLCEELNSTRLHSELIKYFKNSRIVSKILNSISPDDRTRATADEFFYGYDINKKDILDFFNGFISLALELNKLVVICFDEVQFLIDIDPTNVLVKIFLEQIIRKSLEIFRNRRLYIVISCLQNPDKNEYDKLKSISKNFSSIINGKEIVLGNLTSTEKDQILDQICEKVNIKNNDRKMLINKIKNTLGFFLPRMFLSTIAEILVSMGYTSYSESELRTLYETEAREFISPRLKEKGFIHIEESPVKIGGFEFDIYATAESQRNKRVPKAFGEATCINKKSIKGKIEKFISWLNQMKNKEYRPELNDYTFFICPKNRLNNSSIELLKSNNIDYFEFDSTYIDEINKLELEGKPTQITDSPLVEKTIISKKKINYNLKDIPGIGPKKEILLKQVNIFTIEDLIKCNPESVAENISGIGIASLNKWIQKAKQLINQ